MIFIDTGFFYALAAEDDPDHERVREVFEEFDPNRLSQLCLTTNHVVFETITLTRSSSGHREAVSMGRRLYKEHLARIHWATPEEEKKAFDYLVQHKDKGYSAVDCLSFVIMEQYGIQEALAIDRDFTHRFTARPGPRD
jgi:predicted nucleic acid-binding protein